MSKELHVAIRGLTTVGVETLVPRLDIVVNNDGTEVRDEISPVIGVKAGGLYVSPSTVNASIMSAVKTFLADANGWNIAGPFDAEYLIGGATPAASLQIVRKLADTSFSSASPADVPVGASGSPLMAFPVLAGTLYRIIFDSIVQSDTATVGVAMSLTVPAFERFTASARFTGASSDGTDGEYHGNITTSDDAVVPTATVATGTDFMYSINGILIPSADGVVTLRARTEVGTTTVTVRRGSLGMLWALGPI